MRLFLIRHAQSVNNWLAAQNRNSEREFDPEITDVGHQQAELVAQHVAEGMEMPDKWAEPFGITHLYCSAMTRSLQTASYISKALDMPVEIWTPVHEIGGLFLANQQNQVTGFPGLKRSEIEATFPGTIIPDSIQEDGWWDPNLGRETPAAFLARAIEVALELHKRANTNERIAIVSHGAYMDALIKALLNMLPMHPDSLFFTHYNTAITRVDMGKDAIYYGADTISDRMRVHYSNRVAHLPHDLWTW